MVDERRVIDDVAKLDVVHSDDIMRTEQGGSYREHVEGCSYSKRLLKNSFESVLMEKGICSSV